MLYNYKGDFMEWKFIFIFLFSSEVKSQKQNKDWD